MLPVKTADVAYDRQPECESVHHVVVAIGPLSPADVRVAGANLGKTATAIGLKLRYGLQHGPAWPTDLQLDLGCPDNREPEDMRATGVRP